MPDFNEFAQKLVGGDLPSPFWHYTDLHGFLGIVRDRKIRGTDIRFLNDLQEFKQAGMLAKQYLHSIKSKMGSTMFSTISQTFDDISLADDDHAYVTSFSTNRDQLSQWRAYSHGSVGVSLGFDLTKLRSSKDAFVAPCVYDRTAQAELIKKMFGDFEYDLDQQVIDPNVPAEYHGFSENHFDLIQELIKIFLLLSAVFKHGTFGEESEWRSVIFDDQTPEFRVSGQLLVPFISYSLTGSEERTFPLCEVVVGPGASPRTRKSLQTFLSQQGLSLAVQESKIPFSSP